MDAIFAPVLAAPPVAMPPPSLNKTDREASSSGTEPQAGQAAAAAEPGDEAALGASMREGAADTAAVLSALGGIVDDLKGALIASLAPNLAPVSYQPRPQPPPFLNIPV